MIERLDDEFFNETITVRPGVWTKDRLGGAVETDGPGVDFAVQIVPVGLGSPTEEMGGELEQKDFEIRFQAHPGIATDENPGVTIEKDTEILWHTVPAQAIYDRALFALGVPTRGGSLSSVWIVAARSET